MMKPASLREYLQAGHPAIKADPDRLLVRITKGRVVAAYGQGLHFEYRYTLTLTLLDFAGDRDALFALIVAWLSRHQRELLMNADLAENAIGFEVDVLSDSKVDLEITLPLSERVVAVQGETGYDLTHPPEDPFADFDIPAPSLLHEVFANSELLMACAAHHPPP